MTPKHSLKFYAQQEVVDEELPAKWKKKETLPEVTKSFHKYMVKDVLHDFAASSLQVLDNPEESDNIENMPTVHYEFPHGYNMDLGPERFQIPEGLFDPSTIKVRVIDKLFIRVSSVKF